MRLAIRGGTLGLVLGVFLSGHLPAQQDSIRVNRLQAQVDAITRELESLRLGRDVVPQADSSVQGLGPAASKVYQSREGVSIGGYGEILYENFAANRQDDFPAGLTDRIDALRAVIYVGYRFNERFLFNSEIEFEHGSTESGGAVSVEFGYLEYRHGPGFGVRAGMLLAPMGFLNEMHEPPTYLGAHRPETERLIIPSTWHENGVGIFGQRGRLTYRFYVVNGFNGAGFTADEGLREGRQGGSEAAARHFGGIGRVEFAGIRGLILAVSGYLGNSGQSDSIAARTRLVEAHGEYRVGALEVRGLYANAWVDDAALLNAQNGLVGAASIGERLEGWYLQGGFDILHGFTTDQQLTPYLRYERLNTQAQVPSSFSANPQNDRRIVTMGVSWKPITDVVLKTDYQINHNRANNGVNQINVALGYLF